MKRICRGLLVVSLAGLACGEGEAEMSFEVEGSDAIMNGVIGSDAVDRVAELFEDHPDVARIVLRNCPGSKDDEANLEAAFMVRAAKLATHIDAGGEIASGAVDFFIAGTTRTAAADARVGVHSWSGGGVEATELPKDDDEHRKYLDYYEKMGIDEAFYWFTLEAAPAEDIHWMTAEELARYGLLTEAGRGG